MLPCIGYAATDKDTGKGLHFYHQDWEVVCDNTRTCRAAGYQPDEGNSDGFPVSVLFTRQAGAGQPVSGEVMLGNTEYVEGQPMPQSVQLSINNTSYGKVTLDSGLSGTLSASQIQALIAALAGHTVIEFQSGQDTWNLSRQGAAAVLLKMDDVQGRIGTTGALLRQGKKSERNVLPALARPVVKWVKPDRKLQANPVLQHAIKAVDIQQLQQQLVKQQQALQQRLQASKESYSADECPVLTEGDEYATFELTVEPLNTHQLLASGLCWRGAYNEGYGYWVINAQKPYQPKLVTASASDYADGVIISDQKGRGLGDCWSHEAWTWNGQQFIHTNEATTGMCRLIELGGAWELPTQVATVKK
ncbi:MAG: DUF1176 domain-containing protein [Moraxellaceae bacterium]|nr:MAG: DUF1176 domain-containing protein [Moraxellaceae bacterium]